MDEHSVILRPPVWVILTAAVILGGSFIIGKNMERRPDTPAMISVNGEGKVAAIPDIAELTFGVQTGRQSTAQAAMQTLSDSMNAAVAAVKALGIEDKDISTESLWLNPAYDWEEGRQIPRGYEANQSLRVKVRDTSKIGQVLSAATNAGANQAGGVQFTIDDPQQLQDQARAEAIVDAKEKAQALAQQLGVTLGELKGFSEGYAGSPPMPMYNRAVSMEGGMGGGADMGVPLPPGEQEVQMTVSLTYEVY